MGSPVTRLRQRHAAGELHLAARRQPSRSARTIRHPQGNSPALQPTISAECATPTHLRRTPRARRTDNSRHWICEPRSCLRRRNTLRPNPPSAPEGIYRHRASIWRFRPAGYPRKDTPSMRSRAMSAGYTDWPRACRKPVNSRMNVSHAAGGAPLAGLNVIRRCAAGQEPRRIPPSQQ